MEWEPDDGDDGWTWRDGYPHRREPDPEPHQPSEQDRRYVCARCKQELLLAVCKKVERIPASDGLAETVRITHSCPCSAPAIRAARYAWDGQALRRLFGSSRFQLPWPVVHGEEAGGSAAAPPPAPTLSPKESYIERWMWDLSHCNDAHDFLLFCRGPRSEG